MSQLIPPADLAPPSVKHLSVEKRVALWESLMNDCDEVLRAGLRARVGPNGDWKAAYRQWYERCMAEHDLALVNLAENLTKRERRRAW